MVGMRVVISDAAADKLRVIAQREYRAPRQQAAVLLQAAIEAAAAPLTDSGPRQQETVRAAPDER